MTLRGDYCWKIMTHIQKFIDVVSPDDGSRQMKQRRKIHMDMWEHLSNAMVQPTHMCQDFDLESNVPDSEESALGRKAMANEFRKLAFMVVDSYSRGTSEAEVTVYHHILSHHMP